MGYSAAQTREISREAAAFTVCVCVCVSHARCQVVRTVCILLSPSPRPGRQPWGTSLRSLARI